VAVANLFEVPDNSRPGITDEYIPINSLKSFSDPHPAIFLTDDLARLPIVLDTGASISVSPVRADFLGDLQPAPGHTLRGLNHSTEVGGVGTVEWSIIDLVGTVRIIRTRTYFVPAATIRLFSPQVYFQEHHPQSYLTCIVDATRVHLTVPDKTVLEFPFHGCNNLPLMLPYLDDPTVGLTSHDAVFLASPTAGLMSCLSVADESNQNLTASQRELLKWHWRLGHANFQWVQALFANPRGDDPRPDLPILSSTVARVSSCPIPLCAACQVGKQSRRGARTHVEHQVPEKEMTLRANQLSPGDVVHIDQYVSAFLGRLPHTKGKEPKKDQYCGGTIFVDGASSFIFLVHQVSLRAGETVQAKHAFEQYASEFGVRFKRFRADNTPFNSATFQDDLRAHNQSITFSGTGAHHQNGVAERAIKTVSSWARTTSEKHRDSNDRKKLSRDSPG
jgi:hypothetical protein